MWIFFVDDEKLHCKFLKQNSNVLFFIFYYIFTKYKNKTKQSPWHTWQINWGVNIIYVNYEEKTNYYLRKNSWGKILTLRKVVLTVCFLLIFTYYLYLNL